MMHCSNCHGCAVPITTGKIRYSCLSVVTPFQLQPEKKDTVVWQSFILPFQLQLLCRSNYDPKKKLQSSVLCYAIPITTWKKRYSRLAISRCTVPIAKVAAFQLWPEIKRYSRLTVVTPFQLRPKNKKIQLSGHHSLRHSNCHCCAVPIMTGKKKYSHLSVVTPFQIRPEKKTWKKYLWEEELHYLS